MHPLTAAVGAAGRSPSTRMLRCRAMATRPEELYPALGAAYNAGDLEAMLSLYDSSAAFVIKPGRVTEGPAELRAALQYLIDLRGRLTVRPDSFVRSDDVVLVVGTFSLSGR